MNARGKAVYYENVEEETRETSEKYTTQHVWTQPLLSATSLRIPPKWWHRRQRRSGLGSSVCSDEDDIRTGTHFLGQQKTTKSRRTDIILKRIKPTCFTIPGVLLYFCIRNVIAFFMHHNLTAITYDERIIFESKHPSANRAKLRFRWRMKLRSYSIQRRRRFKQCSGI
jgi:hypothetical protein